MLCSSWDIKTTNIGLDGSVVELLTRKTAVPGLSPGPANNFFSSIPTLFMSFSLIFDKITVSKNQILISGSSTSKYFIQIEYKGENPTNHVHRVRMCPHQC